MYKAFLSKQNNLQINLLYFENWAKIDEKSIVINIFSVHRRKIKTIFVFKNFHEFFTNLFLKISS